MHEITDRALDTAGIRGASYADVRVVRRREQSIDVKSGRLAGVLSHETEGFGVRVLVDGAWGFASSHGLTVAEADRVAAQAVRIARASATAVRRPVVLDDRPPARGRFETPVAEDPFAIPLEEKIGDLLAADEAMRRVDGIAFADTTYGAQREEKTFAASDGSFTEQVITHVGAGIEANAVDGAEHQRRSYPDAGGGWQGAGYEYVRSLDLAGTAERVATEAVQLLSAPQLPPGRRTIVLHPSQLYLQVHESCGHPTELDRAFGTEASLAGTSFLTSDKLGAGFRYGSEIVDIVADATAPGGMGTFGWDDEGVAAQAVPLVQGGVFVGYLSSRETAPRIGRRSGGAMRADGWNRIPLIRMTNVNLLPKPGMSLDDIIADTDDGLFLVTNRSWSIDDRRLNFQFAHRARLRDPGWAAGPALSQRHVHRHHAPVLGELRRDWRHLELRDAGHGQLRQGRADADWPRGPRLFRGTVPRRPGGSDVVSAAEPGSGRLDPSATLALAESVLHQAEAEGATEAEVLVAVGDEALTRFANSEIHQNVAESDIRVSLRFVRGRRIGVASSGRTDPEGPAAARRGRRPHRGHRRGDARLGLGCRPPSPRAGRGRLCARHGRCLPGAARRLACGT